MQNIQFTNVRI